MKTKIKYSAFLTLSLLMATGTFAGFDDDLEKKINTYLENKGKDTKQDVNTRISIITELNQYASAKKNYDENELKELKALALKIEAKNLA
jgi:hypothetical protein